MSTAKLLASALGFLLASASVEAKCPLASYTVAGEIRSDRAPVGGATVLFFFDSDAVAAQPRESDTGAEVVTSPSGVFRASFQRSTLESYSRLRGHNCSARPKELEIIVQASGYQPLRHWISVAPKLIRELELRIDIPAVELTRLPAKP